MTARIFDAFDADDLWAYCMGKFRTWAGAVEYAHAESVRYQRRMLVQAGGRGVSYWLVYPANQCQDPWDRHRPNLYRCDEPCDHEGSHSATTETEGHLSEVVLWGSAV